jgi:hypothetical protein
MRQFNKGKSKNMPAKRYSNIDNKEIDDQPFDNSSGNQQTNTQQVPRQIIDYLMPNIIEVLTKENIELKTKLFNLKQNTNKIISELHHEADMFRQQIATDNEIIDRLTKENIELKVELALLKLKVDDLEQKNNALEINVNILIRENTILINDNKSLKDNMTILLAERQDKKMADKMLDVFSYFREYIIKNNYKKNIPGLSYQEIIPTLDESDDKNNSDAIAFVENMGFNVDDVIYFYNLNCSRNGSTHFINNKKYKDSEYMKHQIFLFENEINKLDVNNNLFDHKNNLNEFIKGIKQYM